MKLNAIDFDILSELMKNPKISDRKMAEALGVSQPTITRRRARLEQEELLRYIAVPNFSKLGFELVALSFYSWTPDAASELVEKRDEILKQLFTFLSKHPNIVFTANGRGFGMERMMISIHTSYTDYTKLMMDVNRQWGKYLSQTSSFVVSLETDLVGRKLDFRHFGEYLRVKKHQKGE